MDCLFCKIINGEIPSYTVYEDEIVKCFLDINLNTNGHILIVPKKHFTDVEDIDSDTICHIHEIQKKMYNLVKEKLNCEGCTFAQNNGIAQDVKHYHMHMMPRYKDDGWKNIYSKDLINVEEIYNKIKGN